MGGMLGSILMFIVCLFAAISVVPGNELDPGQVTELTYMTILAVGVIMIGLSGYIWYSEQEKKHYLSVYNAPPGIIPLDKRTVRIERRVAPGPEPVKSWDGENKFVAGLYPPRSEFNLKGNWNFPIVSRQQRFEISEKGQMRIMKNVRLFLPFGLFLLVSSAIAYFFLRNPLASCFAYFGSAIGFAFFLFGLIFLFAARKAHNVVEQDKPAASSISIKSMPYQECFNIVEEILKSLDEPFTKELKEINDVGNIHHQCTFTYTNGNFVRIIYMDLGTLIMRTLSVNYKPEFYLQARKLQTALDTALSKKDIIETIS